MHTNFKDLLIWNVWCVNDKLTFSTNPPMTEYFQTKYIISVIICIVIAIFINILIYKILDLLNISC